MAEADRIRSDTDFAAKAAEACRRANAADATDPGSRSNLHEPDESGL